MKNFKFMKIKISPLCCLLLGILLVSLTSKSEADVMSACGIPISAKKKDSAALTKLLSAIESISKIRGTREVSPLHKKFFGDTLDGETYCSFLKDRISEISINSDIIKRMSFYKWDNSVFVNPEWMEKTPLVHIMMGLIHEAAHRTVMHDHCPETFTDFSGNQRRHPYYNLFACDSSAYGANGIGLVWYKNVQIGCTNCEVINFDEMKSYFNSTFLGGFTNNKARVTLMNDFNSIVPDADKVKLNAAFFEN